MIALGAANFIVQTIFKGTEKTWTHKQYFARRDEAELFLAAIPDTFEKKLWAAEYKEVDLATQVVNEQLSFPLE